MLDTAPAEPMSRAAQRSIRPTGEERSIGPDELLVSKTDPKGVITYANDVFERVSGFPRAELVGRPHNVIRHPDMPKALFKLLWDRLAERQEVFAYINNLGSTGHHYWVLAHVTPSYDHTGNVVGYHSTRRRPAPGAVARVAPLYERLRAEERRHPAGRAALEASSRLMDDLIAERVDGYHDFIWSIINTEEA